MTGSRFPILSLKETSSYGNYMEPRSERRSAAPGKLRASHWVLHARTKRCCWPRAAGHAHAHPNAGVVLNWLAFWGRAMAQRYGDVITQYVPWTYTVGAKWLGTTLFSLRIFKSQVILTQPHRFTELPASFACVCSLPKLAVSNRTTFDWTPSKLQVWMI